MDAEAGALPLRRLPPACPPSATGHRPPTHAEADTLSRSFAELLSDPEPERAVTTKGRACAAARADVRSVDTAGEALAGGDFEGHA